jgi:hypothetical protein
MEYIKRGAVSFFSDTHSGHGALGCCPCGWNGTPVYSQLMLWSSAETRTATLKMIAARQVSAF